MSRTGPLPTLRIGPPGLSDHAPRLGRTRLDILSEFVIIVCYATEHIRQVGLPRCIGQLSSVVGLLPTVGCTVHNL